MPKVLSRSSVHHGELFCSLLETPAGDSLNKQMSLLWGYLLMKRSQMASMGHRLECSPVEREGNNYFPLVRSGTSKASTEELLGTGTKYVNMSNMNKKIENLICRIMRKKYNLGHKTPLPPIWCFSDDSFHHPTLGKVVQWGAEMIQPDFNVVFWGKRKVFVIASALRSFILKLDIATSKIVAFYKRGLKSCTRFYRETIAARLFM